ncbi:MAG TPA: ABC transporter ATP-binding protein [Vicinamibacterales bacterium]|nr:ABC transporter ATP-binding protein [Vicinamibacterales bacterium]
MDQPPVIALRGVTKVYSTGSTETRALADVDLEIRRGEYVAIAGPSGSGKTTLLSIIGLIDTPTAGEYLLHGTPAAALSSTARAHMRRHAIGFVFQPFNLIERLSIFENVELPLAYRGLPVSERRRRVRTTLERVGLAHRAESVPAQLSGGQQQRAAIARALVGEPAILLADEPAGQLDSKSGDAVMDLLTDLHRGGATLCVVTHDARHAARANRTVALFDGRCDGGRAATRPHRFD